MPWLAALGAAACAPATPLPSPPDPAWAIADAAIPFADPYGSDLVRTADLLMRALRKDGGSCLAARFLRVPAARADAVQGHYTAALGTGWQPVALDPPPGTIARGSRRDDVRFAVAVADRPQRGWTGVVIVTNSVWDQPSRDALGRCRES